MPKNKNKNLQKRLLYFQIFIGLFTASIIFRLFIISVGKHGYYVAQADSQHSYFQKLEPNRGDIYIQDAASGKEYAVATTISKDLVFAIPKDIKDPWGESLKLASILGLNAKDIQSKISDTSKSYVVIQHQLSDDQSASIKKAALPGISTDPERFRYYPEKDFLSQVVGFMGYNSKSGDQKIGLYGLEKYFDDVLAGKEGSALSESDSQGLIAGSAQSLIAPEDGSSLVLTIDRSIQYEAETILKQIVPQHGANSGSIIVSDPKTGAILAMANYPDFDPNNYGQAKDLSVYVNNSTLGAYEPGSTMKAITMATGLDLGVINPQTTYQDTGVVGIAGHKIKNAEGKGYGQQSMVEVLDKSLNTGAIFAETQIGNKNFEKYLNNFGFGQPTGIDLPEVAGNLENLKSNSDIDYYTASFGQGITVTPLQMVAAYGALANGGKLMQPYIVDSVIAPDGTSKQTQPKLVRQVISEHTSQQISAMLVDVVENGFGKRGAVPGYWIGGKTGTAQVAENGKYVANDNIGSFIGYGPMEDPKFVILVKVDHPRDVQFAESTAVPAFGQMAQFILNYYHIPPTRK